MCGSERISLSYKVGTNDCHCTCDCHISRIRRKMNNLMRESLYKQIDVHPPSFDTRIIRACMQPHKDPERSPRHVLIRSRPLWVLLCSASCADCVFGKLEEVYIQEI